MAGPFNYPLKGKRSELIKLIVDNESSMKMYLPKMYITSNKGESYIDGYQDLIMLQGNPYFALIRYVSISLSEDIPQ